MDRLLERARSGDKSAEKEIFEALHVRFCLVARHRIADKDEAADVAQKACIIVLEKYRNETFAVNFEAWAYGVLRMCIKTYYRETAQTGRILRDESVTGRKVEASSMAADPVVESRLLECLRKLTTYNRRYARVLNLSYQGYLAEEICQRMNLSRNALYVLLNRARSALWACINQEDASHGKL